MQLALVNIGLFVWVCSADFDGSVPVSTRRAGLPAQAAGLIFRSQLSRILPSLARHSSTISISRPSPRRRWPCGTVSTARVRPTLRTSCCTPFVASNRPTSDLTTADDPRKLLDRAPRHSIGNIVVTRIASLIDGANFTILYPETSKVWNTPLFSQPPGMHTLDGTSCIMEKSLMAVSGSFHSDTEFGVGEKYLPSISIESD